MKDKLYKLYRKYEEEIDVAVIVTVIGTTVYGCFWMVNWTFTKFLQVTGIWYLLVAWIAVAFARTIFMYLEHKDSELKDEDDEHSIL